MTHYVVIALLVLVVLLCWVGAVGAWRMREPTQSLHYLSLPATPAAILLLVAVLVETGWGPATFKTAIICMILIVTNSVGTHATARAIRARQLGHWEPRDDDRVEFITSEESNT